MGDTWPDVLCVLCHWYVRHRPNLGCLCSAGACGFRGCGGHDDDDDDHDAVNVDDDDSGTAQ